MSYLQLSSLLNLVKYLQRLYCNKKNFLQGADVNVCSPVPPSWHDQAAVGGESKGYGQKSPTTAAGSQCLKDTKVSIMDKVGGL